MSSPETFEEKAAEVGTAEVESEDEEDWVVSEDEEVEDGEEDAT